jgi:hypothetical protein
MKTQTSLYDFFTMVIPGFLLLVLISSCGQCNFTFSELGVEGIMGGTLLFIASYIIGLLYHKVVERFTPRLRNNKCCIKKQWEKFKSEYEQNAETSPKKSTKGGLHEYYTAFYALMKANMLYNIPVLEVQVAFLRNMVPITLLYIIAICCCSGHLWPFAINPCCLAIVLAIVLAVMVKAFFSIQNKIYYLVWEGYEYLP